MKNERFRLTGDDVVFEQFDKDLVILDLATGQYFGLNDAATHAWHALMAGMSVAEISACGRFDQTVSDFISKLMEYGLIIADENTVANAGEDVIATLEGCSEAPQIEVFDDLADLIMADPIHDVEEEGGWPRMPGVSS